MTQINLHVRPEFKLALDRFMRLRGIATKSEAIRLAVAEGLERALEGRPPPDFRRWRGAALKASLNPKPRFGSDDELWEDDGR